jgi:RNA polymerase sigma-70 factor (ECF subfamily)
MTQVSAPSEDAKLARLLVLVPPAGKAWSDEALVSAFVTGEPEAAEQIWQKYAPSVDRALTRFLGPGREIEDLTQEVFLRLFAKLPTLEDPRALRSFVYSIAIRVARWEGRRRWIRRCVSLSTGGTVPEQLADAGDFEARQALARFAAIIERLKGPARAAFILRHMEGLSLDDAAQALGISLATLKRRLRRANKSINDQVEHDPALTHYLRKRTEGDNDADQ